VCKPQFPRKDATMRHHSTHLQLSVPALLLQTKHESYARNYVGACAKYSWLSKRVSPKNGNYRWIT
jgi:hypothetical protein